MPHYVQAGAATQVFGVLSLCRVLHTLRTGEIVSKLEAAQWALGESTPPGAPWCSAPPGVTAGATWLIRAAPAARLPHAPPPGDPGPGSTPLREGEEDPFLASGAVAFAAYCVSTAEGAAEGATER